MSKSLFKNNSITNFSEVINSIEGMISKSGKSTNSIVNFFSEKLNANLKLKYARELGENYPMLNKKSNHNFDFKAIKLKPDKRTALSPCFHTLSRKHLEELGSSSHRKDIQNLIPKYDLLKKKIKVFPWIIKSQNKSTKNITHGKICNHLIQWFNKDIIIPKSKEIPLHYTWSLENRKIEKKLTLSLINTNINTDIKRFLEHKCDMNSKNKSPRKINLKKYFTKETEQSHSNYEYDCKKDCLIPHFLNSRNIFRKISNKKIVKTISKIRKFNIDNNSKRKKLNNEFYLNNQRFDKIENSIILRKPIKILSINIDNQFRQKKLFDINEIFKNNLQHTKITMSPKFTIQSFDKLENKSFRNFIYKQYRALKVNNNLKKTLNTLIFQL